MESIIEYMSADHQACDNKFVLAEQAVYSSNWNEAETLFSAFHVCMTHHFRMEEELLFPALLAAGGPQGPVEVMRMEHKQMNDLLDNMAARLTNKDAQGYGGLAETLLILMQQHNLKEEQILYPIADRLLVSDWPMLHSRMLALK